MPQPTLFVPGNLEASDYSETQDVLDKYRPVDYIMNWFENNMGKNDSIMNKILILLSSTGSGKSTVIPPEFYHRFFEKTRKNICCTQPRVLTGIEIPKTIVPYHTKEFLSKAGLSSRKELRLGDNIGYQTGPLSKKPVRGIIYMTIGVLTQQLSIMSDDEFMKKYSIIIIDEAHERSLGTDLALYLIKRFVERHYKNPECPFLVVMSATFDTKKFCDYLLSSIAGNIKYKNIIRVKGFTFPITEHWLKYDATNMYEAIVEKVIEIHQNTKDFIDESGKRSLKLKEDKAKTDNPTYFRDVLIFVPGIGDIIQLKRKLNKLNASHEFFQKYPIIPLELSRDTVGGQTAEYKAVISKDISELSVEVQVDKKIALKKPMRRVIIGTNVAETGITINTLKYVIDSGLHKSNEFNPNFAVDTLVTKPITQGMYKQRRGRAGRISPGECHAIYTKTTFEKMQVDQFPDIIKMDITLDLLNLLIKEVDTENVSSNMTLQQLFGDPENLISKFEQTINQSKINVYKLDLLDLPSPDSLHYSMEKLYVMGAINRNCIPTFLGFVINKFRFVNIEAVKMILSGYAWNVCIIDLITIAACLQTGRAGILPDDLNVAYQTARNKGKFTLYRAAELQKYAGIKSDLIIADDFIQYLLIFNEFKRKLNKINLQENKIELTEKLTKSKKTGIRTVINEIQAWCEKNGVSYSGLVEIAELRDDIINTMCLIGLNPFHNYDAGIAELTLHTDTEKINYIKNLKMCIFEGYKLNIAAWNPVIKKYITRKTHIALDIDSEYVVSKADLFKYGDVNPKYIIYDNILYLPDTASNMYVPKLNNISVLDGYINLDVNFDAII